MLDRLDQAAREYFVWPMSATDENGQPATLTTATITFKTDAGTITKTGPISNGKFRVLIAGPEAPPYDGAVVLPLGRTTYKLSVDDNPERVVGPEGVIYVT